MDNIEHLSRDGYGAILADPPWDHSGGRGTVTGRSPSSHYAVMPTEDIAAMPIGALAAPDSLLFMWTCWPLLDDALAVMEEWGFEYMTCAFSWTKAHANQIEMFKEEYDVQVGMGGWTRSNTEPCLLGKRGNPTRLSAAVRQAIVEPRREHSRKPDCVYERIEKLVGGPYLELFARTRREGWDSWGFEVNKFKPVPQGMEGLFIPVPNPASIVHTPLRGLEVKPPPPLPGQLSMF